MTEEEIAMIAAAPDHAGHALRPESYPLLMDYEMDAVIPAKDGRPWRKACPDCLFRTCDPQNVGQGYQRSIRLSDPARDGLFYCTHRTDAGEHRVCACYAACRHGEFGSAERASLQPEGAPDV
ncbi:hypothetical protein VQ02_23460 [Methylobacterium variabile]|uniref:Uncharacterized protein n=1 Tax=Methylobacterium variabile TaxID=298794 RepID=A0A0J6SGR7_9HYPH|nr:hypothetical protein [Methylobacterium variabile]KMO32508.1 hypothetical protein VQ02_23460 [Methylobacterium variabile]